MALPNEIQQIPLAVYVRPSGLLVLGGVVRELDPFERLGPETRLWVRIVEPTVKGTDEPRFQFAVNEPGDKVATIIADSGPLLTPLSLVLFEFMEVQAVVDLFVYRRGELENGTLKSVHVLAFVDLSRYGRKLGVVMEHSPAHYAE